MKNFILIIIITAAVIAAALFSLKAAHVINDLPSYWSISLILLVLSTLFVFWYLWKSPSTMFVQLYLLTMVVKLVAYASFNLIVILKDRADASANAVFFILAYVIFTGLEVTFLFKKINR